MELCFNSKPRFLWNKGLCADNHGIHLNREVVSYPLPMVSILQHYKPHPPICSGILLWSMVVHCNQEQLRKRQTVW